MRSWYAKGLSRRTPWRWIRDLFDDTMYYRRGRRIAIERDKYVKSIFQASKEIVQNSKQENQHVVKEIPYIESKHIEDYAATSTPSVNVVAVPTPYFIPIPIKTIKFKIEKTKKIITIKIPRIKVNLPALKRLLLVIGIATFILLAFCTVLISYRIIALTDGDFIGETYKMKINEMEKEIVTPLESKVQGLKEDVDYLMERERYREAKELYNFQSRPKIINIYKYNKSTGKTEVETINKP